MKILQINAVYGVGSTGRMTMELHEYMLRQGMDSMWHAQKGLILVIYGRYVLVILWILSFIL